MASLTQAPGVNSVDTCSRDEMDSAFALLHLASGIFGNDPPSTQAAYELLHIHYTSQDQVEYAQSHESIPEAHTPNTTSDASSEFDRDISIFSRSSSRSTAPSDYSAAPSKEELRKKKKAINQKRRRRAKREGTYEGESGERLRPSMKGAEYTREEDDFISQCYLDYAGSNHGRGMPPKELLNVFNSHFPGQKRTMKGLSSHVQKSNNLKALRNEINGHTKTSGRRSSGVKSSGKESSGTKTGRRRSKGKGKGVK